MFYTGKILAVIVALSVAINSYADVRVLHLSPDAPNVDVFVGAAEDSKALLLEDFSYLSVSPYVPLATGSYFIDVNVTGTNTTVIDVNGLGIDGATDYSIAAVNVVASIEPLVLVDDNTIDPLNARLRVVHASPNAGPVDVAVQGIGTVLPGFTFKSASDYFTLPAGAYTVDIFEAGTTNLVASVPNLGLEAGTVYSAFAAGLVGSTGPDGFTVLPTVDAVPEPAGLLMIAIGALGMVRRIRRR